MQTLGLPMFTIADLTKEFGYSDKALFKIVRRGDLRTEIDSTGRLRVPYEEAVRFQQEKHRRDLQ